MRKLEATICPKRLDSVKEALADAAVESVTMSHVKGCHGEGYVEIYRGALYVVDFLPRIKIEVVLEDRFAARVAMLIGSSVTGAQCGDDDVRILHVDDAIRIDSGQRGDRAL
jgi:nitrogen regulatory protein P-II 1